MSAGKFQIIDQATFQTLEKSLNSVDKDLHIGIYGLSKGELTDFEGGFLKGIANAGASVFNFFTAGIFKTKETKMRSKMSAELCKVCDLDKEQCENDKQDVAYTSKVAIVVFNSKTPNAVEVLGFAVLAAAEDGVTAIPVGPRNKDSKDRIQLRPINLTRSLFAGAAMYTAPKVGEVALPKGKEVGVLVNGGQAKTNPNKKIVTDENKDDSFARFIELRTLCFKAVHTEVIRVIIAAALNMTWKQDDEQTLDRVAYSISLSASEDGVLNGPLYEALKKFNFAGPYGFAIGRKVVDREWSWHTTSNGTRIKPVMVLWPTMFEAYLKANSESSVEAPSNLQVPISDTDREEDQEAIAENTIKAAISGKKDMNIKDTHAFRVLQDQAEINRNLAELSAVQIGEYLAKGPTGPSAGELKRDSAVNELDQLINVTFGGQLAAPKPQVDLSGLDSIIKSLPEKPLPIELQSMSLPDLVSVSKPAQPIVNTPQPAQPVVNTPQPAQPAQPAQPIQVQNIPPAVAAMITGIPPTNSQPGTPQPGGFFNTLFGKAPSSAKAANTVNNVVGSDPAQNALFNTLAAAGLVGTTSKKTKHQLAKEKEDAFRRYLEQNKDMTVEQRQFVLQLAIQGIINPDVPMSAPSTPVPNTLLPFINSNK
uniref:Uncharacterized protein n=1 Tax=Clandestinovirus TaxID=2831644 RepID=A0A8F8PMT8_9VIRU|nr:hypothetical protein KOM_12_577 [Clandestinovirus]